MARHQEDSHVRFSQFAHELERSRGVQPSSAWMGIAVSTQRQALAELDDHFLKDIGVTRQQAIIEAAKPFWK